MMDLATIRAISDRAAREAARAEKRPYIVFNADEVKTWKVFPFPFLGSYVPKGWRLIEKLFVDKTGWGYESEPAMTHAALRKRLIENCDKKKTYGYALVEEGQFQVYVGVYVFDENAPGVPAPEGSDDEDDWP